MSRGPWSRRLALPALLAAVAAAASDATGSSGATALSTAAFFRGLESDRFDVVVDVRPLPEWSAGHLLGATLAESLGADGLGAEVAAAVLGGCEYCTLALYGGTADAAVAALRAAGFQGALYTAGAGPVDWAADGHAVVLTNGTSEAPPCVVDPAASEACRVAWMGRFTHTSTGGGHDDVVTEESTTGTVEPPTLSPALVGASSGFPWLTPEEVYKGTLEGRFGLVLDVRTEVADWATTGRLPNATVLLQLLDAAGGSVAGCEFCDIVAYGDTFLMAQQTLQALAMAGFRGALYVGPTVAEYEAAGYALAYGGDTAALPACVTGGSGACYAGGGEGWPTVAPSATEGVVAAPTTAAADDDDFAAAAQSGAAGRGGGRLAAVAAALGSAAWLALSIA